jgi:hypothetical protein
VALFDAAVSIPLVTVDREGYLGALATGTFYNITISAPTPPSTPLTVVADFPVEWDGSFDLVFEWNTIQLLVDDLLFFWTEVPDAGILGADLPFDWSEQNALEDLTFNWVELPAGLLDAYEMDPQRPYGRVSKP